MLKKFKFKQLNFKISEYLLKRMDSFINEIGFRSRGQILNIALFEWIERQEYIHMMIEQQKIKQNERPKPISYDKNN